MLPSDTLKQFATSFNQLVDLNPHEIQLGILKRLRGAPLNRHNEEYQMCYNQEPPYNVLQTRDIDFMTMQRINRMARYWDMIANSGRFRTTLPLILACSPFENFLQFSDALYEQAGSTWKIALRRLFGLIYSGLMARPDVDMDILYTALLDDYQRSGEKGDFDSLLCADKYYRTGIANRRQLNVLQ